MKSLLRDLKRFYKTHKRDSLPWRGTRDPYKILVSEIMLQQTQVERVAPFYKKFIKRFPTFRILAKASLPEVLSQWQGLGYNRRAKFLREAAKMITSEYKGKFPKDASDIEKLPGVGPYTARAVSAFAFNKPEVFLETNIRTVYFYTSVLQNTSIRKDRVSDAEILSWVEKALQESRMQPRDFYAALMDYGSYLKRRGVRLNNKSKHYTKQSKFEGSSRQLRGAIVRELLKESASVSELARRLAKKQTDIKRELAKLQKEKMIKQKAEKYSV